MTDPAAVPRKTGSCDPATWGATYHEFETEVSGVNVRGRFEWDGVSNMDTGCDGPIIRVWATNRTMAVKYVWFQGRRGRWRSIQLDPGADATWNGNVLAQRGFATAADLEGLIITDSDTPT